MKKWRKSMFLFSKIIIAHYIKMVFECSFQTFRLHSLHCCLTFRSLLRGETMQRFFWGGPSSARACFCGPITTKRASSARTLGALKPFGYCALFSIFGLINSCQVHKEIETRHERSYLYQVQLEVEVCTRWIHYMLINPGCMEHRKRPSWCFVICCVVVDFLIQHINTCFGFVLPLSPILSS